MKKGLFYETPYSLRTFNSVTHRHSIGQL